MPESTDTFLKNTTYFLSKILHIFEKANSAHSPLWSKHVGEGCMETKGSGSSGSVAYSAAESKNRKQTHNFCQKRSHLELLVVCIGECSLFLCCEGIIQA